MPVHEYLVQQQDGHWGIWFHDRLICGQPSQREALLVAQAIANGASARGQRSTIRLVSVDGVSVDYPVFGTGNRSTAAE